MTAPPSSSAQAALFRLCTRISRVSYHQFSPSPVWELVTVQKDIAYHKPRRVLRAWQATENVLAMSPKAKAIYVCDNAKDMNIVRGRAKRSQFDSSHMHDHMFWPILVELQSQCEEI